MAKIALVVGAGSGNAQLEIHVPGALRNGLSREEIEEVILQLTVYAGYPAAVEAIRATRRIFAGLDDSAADEATG